MAFDLTFEGCRGGASGRRRPGFRAVSAVVPAFLCDLGRGRDLAEAQCPTLKGVRMPSRATAVGACENHDGPYLVYHFSYFLYFTVHIATVIFSKRKREH